MLISILACSLGFHAITSECSTYENRLIENKGSAVLSPLVSLFYLFVARGGRNRDNRRTDGQTDRTTTVTLAAHAHAEG